MTVPEPTTIPVPRIPLQLKVAGALCAVVGIFSVFEALAVSPPLVSTTWVPLVVKLVSALCMCFAAVFVWKQRRLGAFLILLGLLLPVVANVMSGASTRLPSLLSILAFVALALSWHLSD